MLVHRESDLQHVDTNRLFHTPGYYYRPNQLKNMTCLLGNTETRTVYRNFELNNLNVNLGDRSHMLYASYLSYNRFLPPEESRYFAHLATNTLAAAPGNADNEKGAFNIFPLSLTTSEMQQSKSVSSSLGKGKIFFTPPPLLYTDIYACAGVVSTSPLKLELQFEPVLTVQWFMMQTHAYLCRIDFTGSKMKQEVLFDFV